MNQDTESTVRTLVADGKGILAADETPGTLTKRFDALGIRSTEQSRRVYRELLFSAPDTAAFISGVIMQDETMRQKSSTGTALPQVLASRGIVPGIKVDTGAKPLAGAPGETITEGLDGLRERLTEYRGMGARFAKWRAVIHIADGLPSRACVSANAHALARYATVLTDGSHSIERCEEVTTIVLHGVFQALFEQRVALESMLLKPNMVVPGKSSARPASVQEVAIATLRCLRQHVPAAVPGIVFLSGGQSARQATAHLNAINRLPGPKPWKISFSYGRALQDAALEAWHGRDENVTAAQEALSHRARCNGAASLGRYTDDMEASSPRLGDPAQRHDAHDDWYDHLRAASPDGERT
jgi:fructose-bisphosphate aldolase, class I